MSGNGSRGVGADPRRLVRSVASGRSFVDGILQAGGQLGIIFDTEHSVRLEFGGLVMGRLLLEPGSEDRSSRGCRLRMRITLWESSSCESPGSEVRCVRG